MAGKHRQKIRKAIKKDIKVYVAEGKLPDVDYRVSLARNHRFSNGEGHRVEGMDPQQSFTFGGYHIMIAMSMVPQEFADLDKQRGLRDTLFDLVNKYRSEEEFAVGVKTQGLYQTEYRYFDDLLEAAVHKAVEEVRKKNGGKLPISEPILTNVPHRYWIC